MRYDDITVDQLPKYFTFKLSYIARQITVILYGILERELWSKNICLPSLYFCELKNA